MEFFILLGDFLFPDLTVLWLSLQTAGTGTAIVAVAGTLLGRHLARRRYRGREFVDALTSLPLFLPPTVLGYYLTIALGHNGPLGGLGIPLTFTWYGAAVAAAVAAFPLMVRSARIAFESVDREVEDCAALDGAGHWETFRHIVLPLTRSGLAGGVALSFARAIGEFGATMMIAGNIPGRTQTLPLAIYDAFTMGDDPTASSLALLLTVVSLIVVVAGLRLGRR